MCGGVCFFFGPLLNGQLPTCFITVALDYRQCHQQQPTTCPLTRDRDLVETRITSGAETRSGWGSDVDLTVYNCIHRTEDTETTIRDLVGTAEKPFSNRHLKGTTTLGVIVPLISIREGPYSEGFTDLNDRISTRTRKLDKSSAAALS